MLSMKSNKACSLDGVAYDYQHRHSKSAHKDLVPLLTTLLNYMLDVGNFPHNWIEGLNFPIHKGGDHNNPNNYIKAVSRKIFQPQIMFILHGPIQRASFLKQPLYIAFVNFRRAFGTINRITRYIT